MSTYYTVAATIAILISAVVIFLIFSKLKLLSLRLLISTTVAALLTAISLPGVYSILSVNEKSISVFSAILPVAAVTIAIYIVLVIVLSVVISHVIPKISAKQEETVLQADEAALSESDPSVNKAADGNYLEQIFINMNHEEHFEFTGGAERENEPESVEKAEKVDVEENNFEKSVDSDENIDKMGIENIVQESENLTIEECIEEAFRLKAQGDGEGAILYFMYALDKMPDQDLTFWIVLDICVLYKALGQSALAFDILNGYYDTFGENMDISVRKEIESNLAEIQA